MCLSSGTSLDSKHFDTLKLALLDAPVLRLSDVNQDFRVKTDESDFAVAGVLCNRQMISHGTISGKKSSHPQQRKHDISPTCLHFLATHTTQVGLRPQAIVGAQLS